MTILLSEEEVERQVAIVRDTVVATIPRLRRRRRKQRAIIAAATVAAATLTGAAIVVHATQDQINYEVSCYGAPSLDSEFVQVQSAIVVADDGDSDRVRTDPIETCGAIWRMGGLGQESEPMDPNAANFDVPDLVGCMLPSGASAGFPRGDSDASGDEFCRGLGLAPWE